MNNLQQLLSNQVFLYVTFVCYRAVHSESLKSYISLTTNSRFSSVTKPKNARRLNQCVKDRSWSSEGLLFPNSMCGLLEASPCAKRWQIRTEMRRRRIRPVRALTGNRDWKEDEMRSRTEGFSGGARNAMAKSVDDDGDEGVTMIAGRGDFSVRVGSERSSGAGRRV